ncbi:hypothetical protein AB0J90_09725 [Micromonospora sp. NPDC049523]|uniref:hypothetical protein n=1 Tax=Micromonospora sp. NPDC049523 TaxID=3155921 RepID=UPI00342B8AE0
MSRLESPHRRATAVLLAAAAVSAVGLPAGAAEAVPVRRAGAIGPLTVEPTSGTVDANPMLVSATTPAPCPARYGAAAMLRVGPVGGPYSNIVRPGQAGDYDKAAFTMTSNRSMLTSQGQPPTDGEYQIVVECVSGDLGPHPDRFVTSIVVSGNTWRVKGMAAPPAAPPTRAGSSTNPPAPVGPAATAPVTAPATDSGPPRTGPAPAEASTPPGSPAADARLAGEPVRDGTALPWVLGALVVVLAAAGAAVPLIRRRRRVQP